MLPYSKPLLLGLWLFAGTGVAAQCSDQLALLNTAFKGLSSFKVDKHGNLVIDHFDAGIRTRQDVAPLADLDPATMAYTPNEDALVLRCRTDRGHCFSKEVFKLNLTARAGSMALARPTGPVHGERVLSVLQELVFEAQGHLASAPAETPLVVPRKHAY